MTQHVIITRGLPASGKTTWSRQWVKKHPDYKRLNRDDLRAMICFGTWSKKKEEAVLLAREELIHAFLTAGYNLVLDDTNLDPFRMGETMGILRQWSKDPKKLKITIKDFTDVPLETCIMRNENRDPKTQVPERFIRMYYNKYIKTK